MFLTVAASLIFVTPEAAAISVTGHARNVAPIVVRANVSGAYATVLVRGGRIEGAPVHVPILVQHFAFGWQPLDVLNDSCELSVRHIEGAVRHALSVGMPPVPTTQRACDPRLADSGPRDDVAGVRKLMRGPFVPYVTVVGDWAMGQWYGAGGGQNLFHRENRTWTLIAGGGGAMGIEQMREYRVPEAVWCRFQIPNAKCP